MEPPLRPPAPPSSYSVSSLLHQVIVDWFNSIRAVQLHYLKVAFPGATDAEVMTATMTIVFLCVCVKCVFYLCVCFQLVPKLTRNFLKEGYMEKTGPRVSTTHNTHTHSTVNDIWFQTCVLQRCMKILIHYWKYPENNIIFMYLFIILVTLNIFLKMSP